MKFYKVLESVKLRKESGVNSDILGVIVPNTIVYELNNSHTFGGETWRHIFARVYGGEWLEGYSIEKFQETVMLEPWEPHVKLGSPYQQPVRITQLFGENPQLYAQFGYDGHNGCDLANGQGTPIHAIAPGTVEHARTDSGYGNYIKITGATISTIYAHMVQLNVTEGSYVNQGDVIGLEGSSGHSFGSHLHIELRLVQVDCSTNGYGGRIDILPYLDWTYLQFPTYCNILNNYKEQK